jgi:hypothetical protein
LDAFLGRIIHLKIYTEICPLFSLKTDPLKDNPMPAWGVGGEEGD